MSKSEENKRLEIEFYAEPFSFSYSSMNKLLYSPQLFYKDYILKQRDDILTPALLEGKAIHCLILDRETFHKQFLLLPGNMPSENPKKVIDRVFQHYQDIPAIMHEDGSIGVPPVELDDYGDVILEILKEIDLHQSLKTDAQRLEKMITDANKEYFKYLFQRGTKDIIDIPTFEYCSNVAEMLRDDPRACEILGIGHEETDVDKQVLNELPMQTSFANMPFGIKGILDNVIIDWKNKVIRINDVKTTSKTLVDFKDAIDFWRLWLQAAIYKRMVYNELIINNNLDSTEWKIEFAFVVIDKYKQWYPFKVSEETMKKWEDLLDEKLEEIKWHYEQRRYDLPYQLATTEYIL